MTNFNEVMKLYNKPFEDMSLRELYAEQSAHNWHKHRMKKAVKALDRRRWWLDEHWEILPKEEIKRQYEDGEIDLNHYRTAMARRQRGINQRMYVEDRMNYAEIIIAQEEAVVAYLEELKQALKLKEAEANKHRVNSRDAVRKSKFGYNPRKKTSKYNTNKTTDPNRTWATRKAYQPMPSLQKARARWKAVNKEDRKATQVQKRMQPIVTWDVDTLRMIAKDRGYYTDVAMVANIAEHLNVTIGGAQKLIDNGKLSWGQCIVIGALFEMTPKEFCDTFLSGYFREVADGVYKAYVEDTASLLDRPYQPKAKGVDDGQIVGK